jgi:hypothetical protein
MAESALEIALSETRFLKTNECADLNYVKKKGILPIIFEIR